MSLKAIWANAGKSRIKGKAEKYFLRRALSFHGEKTLLNIFNDYSNSAVKDPYHAWVAIHQGSKQHAQHHVGNPEALKNAIFKLDDVP
jgi:hypothetical protein